MKSETTNIVVNDRIIAKVLVEDVNSDKYYRLKISFPDGSWRELYVSFRTLEKGSFEDHWKKKAP